LTTINGTLIYNGSTKNDSHLYELQASRSYLFRYLMIRRSSVSVLTICEIKMVQDSEYNKIIMKSSFDEYLTLAREHYAKII
jgi:hypothetical protein